MNSSSSGQIPLALDTHQQPGFDLFVPGDNTAALEHARNIAAGTLRSNLYLWGAAGTGVTHLLQAACKLAADAGRTAAYIPLRANRDLDPGMLENMEVLDLVCVDDIDQIGGQAVWEQSMLHFYNHRRDDTLPLLIGAHTGPPHLDFTLPDLKSRMAWDLVCQLKALADGDKIELLQRRAAARAFALPPEVAAYLVQRVRRDLPYLIALLDRLQRASLAEQRKLTVPFVKSLL